MFVCLFFHTHEIVLQSWFSFFPFPLKTFRDQFIVLYSIANSQLLLWEFLNKFLRKEKNEPVAQWGVFVAILQMTKLRLSTWGHKLRCMGRPDLLLTPDPGSALSTTSPVTLVFLSPLVT